MFFVIHVLSLSGFYILGSLFDVNDTSEYVETIIAKCIDHYTKLRVSNSEADELYQKPIDPK